MTLMEKVEYWEYCHTAKKFLDDIDPSLWVRFTQVNPYEFYRLDQPRIREIAESIIKKRQEQQFIKELNITIKQNEIDRDQKRGRLYNERQRSFHIHTEATHR